MDLAYMAELPTQEFVERRAKLFEYLDENSVAVIFSATEQTRSKDTT